MLTRPLGYYVVIQTFTLSVGAWLMFYHGFQLRSSNGLQMLVKPASAKPSSRFRLPIVFLHGLGIGLGQYIALLRRIAHSDRGVVVLLQPGISTAIWHPRFLAAPPPASHAAAIKEICDAYGFKKTTVLSHSNGTMVHCWLIRAHPELCTRNVLVDPVSFKLWEGDVCYSFAYQTWKTGMELTRASLLSLSRFADGDSRLLRCSRDWNR